mgnify:FL=1
MKIWHLGSIGLNVMGPVERWRFILRLLRVRADSESLSKELSMPSPRVRSFGGAVGQI